MLNLKKPMKQFYNELEAAQYLGITVEALYEILDKHVFNAEHPRPQVLEFTHPELILLTVWAEPTTACNVLSMPARKSR